VAIHQQLDKDSETHTFGLLDKAVWMRIFLLAKVRLHTIIFETKTNISIYI